jgi:hypothetical protein
MTDTAPQQDQQHIIHGAESMLGDLMSIVLDLAKALPKPWQALTEADQVMWISKVDMRCKKAIEECVAIIATRNAQRIAATVDSVTFKKAVKVTLKMPHTTPGAHLVADYAGEAVLIVVADQAELTGEHHKPTATPQQPALTE